VEAVVVAVAVVVAAAAVVVVVATRREKDKKSCKILKMKYLVRKFNSTLQLKNVQ
jgi:hypothetical protein